MKRFFSTISSEQLNRLPIKAFDGEIVIVDNLYKVDSAIRYLSSFSEIGFDTETRPSFRKGRMNGVALLQLSTQEKAFLFRTCCIGLPQQVADFLANKNIKKIGVAIRDDIKGLQKHCNFIPGGFVELQDFVKQFGIEVAGLKKLNGIVLGYRISKAQQLSNWESDELTQKQKIYGATDAWSGLLIYNELLKHRNKMNYTLLNHLEKTFDEKFGGEKIAVRAPGRINIIGEHTDYNEGFVLPAAVPAAIYFAIGRRNDNKVNLYSTDFKQQCEFSLNDTQKPDLQWASYLFGVTKIIQQRGYKISGFNCVFGGDIPVGSGMSSSAALESGLAFGISQLNNLNITPLEMAKIGQQSEHEYVGVKCGIMDQYASIFGKEGKCIKLDCRSLQHEYANANIPGYVFILSNTMVKHSLASSEYNKRRSEVEEGVAKVKALHPEVKSLRDCTLDMIDEIKSNISETIYRRCRFVIEENERVTKACERLNNGEIEEFGKLIYQSHYGLSQMYEVSCKELDFLVSQTESMDYVLGSRMMGGGFGGCTISLVKAENAEEFKKTIAKAYKKEFNIDPQFYQAVAENGVELL
ncbi:MAG: galactokinase [Bacteroidales bacterium]|nr:galactokinase [Bacteroidales bacterium]